MAHWSEAYIGRPYVLGVADCGSLCVDVRREIFGGAVPDRAEIERAVSRGARSAQIAAGVADICDQTDKPEEGDVVHMRCRAKLQHVGVYCIVDGEPCVLHALEKPAQVVRTRLRELSRVRLKVEGFYKWK